MPSLALLAALSQRPSRPRIAALFGAEPDRMARFALDVAGIRFDFAKQDVAQAELDALMGFARDAGLHEARRRLFAGEVVNASENRAATHWAERAAGPSAELADTVARVEAGGFGPARHVIALGIGGSALGPALVLDALRDGHRRAVHVVANVDGAALAAVLKRCDPAATLLVVVSKSFTTLETMLNARSAQDWLAAAGVGAAARTIAVTAYPQRAAGFGAAATLGFPETVGGRYSLWSAVGLPIALALGLDRFAALLAGARAMDAHFAGAPDHANAPLLAALIDLWNHSVLAHPTRAVFAYDERLRLLTPFLQQLEMESNGKRVAADGGPLGHPSAPVTWGGVGTDAQHAVFQWLHQGTSIAPAEFVAARQPGHDLPAEHHRQLLANAFAQTAALMRGRTHAEALAQAGGDAALAAARTFPGNRPSTTILLDRLDEATLGALLAFQEHRAFAFGVLCGVNPFDQWGVELGKEMATALASGGGAPPDPSTAALMAAAGL
jgi:glucose-6-phosphate isomerase